MKEPQHKKVGVWIRTSTDLESQKEAPEHHLERAKSYCEYKQWDIVKVYDLTATSGKSVLDLPQTKEMLSDIEAGRISGLIFSKLARLARSTRELLDLADKFNKHDADLISLGESIDTSSPAGTLFFTVLAALAQFEREEISARVSASVPVRARLGKNTGGAAPLGYKWTKSGLVIEEKEAPIIKRLFELFLETKRKRTTARLLNEEGYRTRAGKNFSYTSVNRLLNTPTMKGLHKANYTRSRGDKKAWDLKPASEWVFTQVPAIIDEESYDQVQEILKAQKRSRKPVARKPVRHLFTGLTFCECGGKMYIPSNSPSYTCRKCRKKIHKEDLESIYLAQLKEFLLSQDEIEKYILEANTNFQDKQDELNLLLSEEKKIKTKMDQILELYLSESLGKVGFERKNTPLEERLIQIQTQIPVLQGTIAAMKQTTLSSQQIAEETGLLYAQWDKLKKDDQLKVIETITQEIRVGDDEVELHLHYLPFANANPKKSHTLSSASSSKKATTKPRFNRD